MLTKNKVIDLLSLIFNKLKGSYKINSATKQMEKHRKLLELGVLTREQYEAKAKELQKSIIENL